jgi:outer membrane receptor protein involved in Fe transport
MGGVTRSFTWLKAAAVVALMSPALPWAAGPDDTLELDLAGGPLGATLLQIARTSGSLVSFNPLLVSQRVAPPIRGRFTLIEALTLATRDSGLVIEITPAGAATVLAQAPAAPPATPRVAASPVDDPLAQAALPPVVVVGTGKPRDADGLTALRSWSASRTDTPLTDLPQAVSVLTADALSLQGGATSTEAMRFVTGVGLSVDPQGTGGGLVLPGVRVRGLPALYALSGMRTMRGVLPADTPFIERIEVSKGPSATIAGVSEIGGRGGVVNVVRKEAGPEVRTEVSQSLSTQDNGTLRLGADVGGALQGGQTFWRLIGYGNRTGRTEGGYTGQFGAGVLGSLTYRGPDFRAALTVQADRRRTTPTPDSLGGGVPLEDGSFIPVQEGQFEPLDPTDRVLASTGDVEVDLDWRFSPNWRTTWKARIEAVQSDMRRHQFDTVDLARSNRGWNAGMQWGLVGDVATGPARHKLLLALDLERWRLLEQGVNTDGFDPNGVVDIRTQEFKQALLLQDQVQLGPLRLRLAVQRARTPLYEEQGVLNYTGERTLATSWDTGALYQLTPGVSVYGGTQFAIETDRREAIGFTLADGSTAPLGKLRQSQVGAKFQWLGGRLASTVEAFRLRHTDLAYSSSLVLPGRSLDGLEFELSGRLRPDLDLNLGFTFMRGSEVVPTPDFLSGRTVALTGVPARSLFLLARYQLPEWMLAQSRLGIGLRTESSRVAAFNFEDPQFLLTLPGGTQVDLSLERLLGPWTLNAFVRNAFDRQLYGAQADPRYIPLLPKRSFGLTATYKD